MLDIHIDDFFKDSALIFKTLYNAFPRRHDLFVEDIIGGPDALDEFGLHSRRHEACLSCMLWLAEEKLIRHNGLIQLDGLDQAVLSNRALSLLCSTPSAEFTLQSASVPVPAPATFIALIHGILAEHSSEHLRCLMVDFFKKHDQYNRG